MGQRLTFGEPIDIVGHCSNAHRESIARERRVYMKITPENLAGFCKD
jgi:hypothetical protein